MPEYDRNLCVTCDNKPTCMYQAIRRWVFDCEGFWQRPPALAERRNGHPPRDDEDPSINGVQGLCVNCGNRGHCTLQHVEGGIWHCEEYC